MRLQCSLLPFIMRIKGLLDDKVIIQEIQNKILRFSLVTTLTRCFLLKYRFFFLRSFLLSPLYWWLLFAILPVGKPAYTDRRIKRGNISSLLSRKCWNPEIPDLWSSYQCTEKSWTDCQTGDFCSINKVEISSSQNRSHNTRSY